MLHYLLAPGFLEKIWSWLNAVDTRLFLLVNGAWTNSFLDSVFPWWRDADTWIPLYFFLILFAIMNFRNKAFPWILFAVLTVVLTDQFSSTLVKNWIGRVRPCRDEFLMTHVRLLVNGCSGGYSFTSSHATNHFGFAMFVYMTTKSFSGRWGQWLFVWAATIAYGQVYVGVHYPLDVICGALTGCGIGYVTAYFFNNKIGLPSLIKPNQP